MKNIYILPTENFNPLGQQIWVRKNGGYFKPTNANPIANCLDGKVNIYITNYEEIKEGNWLLNPNGIFKVKPNYINCNPTYKKIILTTDTDLIKDGVQSIDDEFLEWFVKNPSCEVVEVIKTALIRPFGSLYKIIIPKEEPKQDLEKEMFELEQELDIPSHLRWHNSKPKQDEIMERFIANAKQQETLEEVAERYAVNRSSADVFRKAHREDFINGAKWQEQQTIEEVFEWLTTKNYLTDLKETMIKDFNKFKKK